MYHIISICQFVTVAYLILFLPVNIILSVCGIVDNSVSVVIMNLLGVLAGAIFIVRGVREDNVNASDSIYAHGFKFDFDAMENHMKFKTTEFELNMSHEVSVEQARAIGNMNEGRVFSMYDFWIVASYLKYCELRSLTKVVNNGK